MAGIELVASGQKVAWSISDYLDSLEKGFDELLKRREAEKAKKPQKPTPNPTAEHA